MVYVRTNYDEYQKDQICKAIGDLYMLQDRPITEGKKVLLCQEFEDAGLPYKACVAGLRSLHNADLKMIKLSILKDAIYNFIVREDVSKDCVHCRGEGAVIMFDDNGMKFALACTCSLGDKTKLVRWNGKSEQDSKNRILRI